MNRVNPFYITTPIYYANAELHLGHAFTTIAADAATRFQRAMGRKAFFLTGSDEHGQKVQQAATAAGITPQEHCDRMAEKFKALWTKLDITYDRFIRTTDPAHREAVQHVLTDLHNRGHIYESTYSGLYCTPCERFWTEKDVPDKLCPDCKRPVHEISEKSHFFRMSAFQQQLIDHISANPGFIRPENRRNEVLGFLAQPLNDLCISRPKARLSWGIELPFAPDYVTYVWVDALTNYISAIGYPRNKECFGRFWPANYHLIGKDILTTHSVYWCTMLLALGLPLPQCIFAHGWWVVDEVKMSKTTGNVLNPLELVDRYGLDPFRYFILREMVFGSDASFSDGGFVTRYNADLANDLGNLCHRTLPQVLRHRDGTFHKPATLQLPASQEIAALAVDVKKGMIAAMEELMFHEALKKTWELVSRLNKYIDTTAPWTLAKEGKTELLDEVFYVVGEGIRHIAHLIAPVMPHIAPKFIEQLGLPPAFEPLPELVWGGLPDGLRCKSPEPLFPRIDTERIAALKGQTAEKPAKAATDPGNKAPAKADSRADGKKTGQSQAGAPPATIDYDTFMQTELAIGEVIAGEKVEGADRLLKLTVRIGEEQRQVVAGIALYYQPADLIGKQVVVVKNLKPAKIRGIESHGMILAAGTDDGGLALVVPSKPAKPGVRVK